jgi:hypothetical protein
MDLKKAILKEHSKTQTEKIVNYVGNDPKRFNELLNVFLAGPYRVTQRAGWPLSYCVEYYPALIIPHLKKVLDHLKKPGIHDSVKRNTMRLLQYVDIPKRFHASVMSVCFQYLGDRKEPLAARVFAMSVLGQMTRSHPDLKQELKIIIEDNLPYTSPAFTSRAKKLLRQLDTK